MKILILKPSSLGDVVQAIPVLRLIKRTLPHSQIYWWIETGLAGLLEDDDDLAGLVRFDRKRWGRPAHWPEVWQSLRWARAQAFDWVIDLQCLARSGVFAWLANGKFTVGLDEPREGARGLYDCIARRASYHTHAVDWYLSVLPLLGVPVNTPYVWLPERPATAQSIDRRWGISSRQWIAIQPGARWPNKRWPVQHFSELIRLACEAFPHSHFAILGGAEDRTLGQQIASACNPDRCLDLTGRLSLAEMVEWLRLSSIMVSNDTGPMHVAAALGKPVIGLFGPTDPARTGPYRQTGNCIQTRLPCVPCMSQHCSNAAFMECMHMITPAEVLEKLRRNIMKVPVGPLAHRHNHPATFA